MENNSENIELEKSIDAYIKGKLTETEAEKLWAELLMRPDYISRLQTQIDLTRYHQQNAAQKTGYGQYWRWFAAAAAVVLVVAGINFFSGEALSGYTIETILLRKNLASATVMRSEDPHLEIVDSLLNSGYEKAVEGNTAEAIAIYNKVISQYPNTIFAAKAYLNLGILTYNSDEFESSILNFKKVLSIVDQNSFIKEQAYWYLGNALLNVEKLEQAREAIYKAAQLNGVHRQQALRLLEKLDKKSGQ